MSDAASRLARLRVKRDAATDPEDRADLDAAITALERKVVPSSHDLDVGEAAQVGVAVAGDVTGGVVAPLFPAGASGNYIAGVLNLYQQGAAASQADYGAALRRYLEHLYREYASLDLRGIDDRPMDMPLSELYVSLSLHEPPPDDLRGRGGLRGFMEKVRTALGQKPEDEPALRGSAKPVDWTNALRHPLLAVIGAPGSGKTTLLHYTAVRLAEVLARDDRGQLAELGMQAEAGGDIPPVPLFLPLRELGSYVSEATRRDWAGAGPSLLLACLANYYARFELDLPDDFFGRLCEAGRAILLLDGLDEVSSTDDRALVASIVRASAGRYRTCRFVVTSRVAAYQGDAQIGAGFRICTVADLDAAQQQKFIGNWSRSLHRLLYRLAGEELDRRAVRYAGDLWRALEQNDRVRGLASNPLLLTVVAVIFHNNYVLPEDRAALYEECVEVLLRGGRGKADRPGQQRRDYGGRPELMMGLDPKREILAAVAYRMHQRGEQGVFIARDELVREVASVMQGRYPDSDATARAFVSELPVHIGLLDEREPDRFRFSHLSFQEFLAARHIAEATEDRWDELLARSGDSWWREVILLCAGHLSQERCWRFLERLVERGATVVQQAMALGLAADALAELERFKGQGPLGDKLRDRALAIFELEPAGAAPAQARVECGRVLARVGDPRSGVYTLPPPMVALPGATFQIGNTPEEYQRIIDAERRNKLHDEAKSWYENSVNTASVTIAPFELARYPVTNAQYRLFIDAGGYNPQAAWWDDSSRAWLARDDHATKGLESWQRRRRKEQPEFWDDERVGATRPNHPVVGISWYEAMTFCRWLTAHLADGYVYRLPSEAEWEYAARGTARRMYAWGDEPPDAARANFEQTYSGTVAVGSLPAGQTIHGLCEMTGNVWEWTRSEYRSYPYDPTDGREAGAEVANKRFTFRGGGWVDPPFFLRASRRNHLAPDLHDLSVGFRLARHPNTVKR